MLIASYSQLADARGRVPSNLGRSLKDAPKNHRKSSQILFQSDFFAPNPSRYPVRSGPAQGAPAEAPVTLWGTISWQTALPVQHELPHALSFGLKRRCGWVKRMPDFVQQDLSRPFRLTPKLTWNLKTTRLRIALFWGSPCKALF